MLTAEFPDLALTEVRDQSEFDALLPGLEADAVITDYQLRWTDGLKVLAQVRDAGPDVPVVMFTHTGSEEVAAAGFAPGSRTTSSSRRRTTAAWRTRCGWRSGTP